MLSIDKLERMETAMADKGYDSEEMINFLKEKDIKSIIDIQNKWKDEETTRQYKSTNIVYSYDGKVSYVDENTGKLMPMKYLGYDKVKDTLRYEYKGKIYSIEILEDPRVFTPIARNSKKWKRLYKKKNSYREN